MKNMISVIRDKLLSWFLQLGGIAVALCGLLISAGGFGNYFSKEDRPGLDIFLSIFFLLVGVAGIFMVIRGRKIHALLAEFRLYASILATNEEKSVKKIASATNQPLEAVMKKANKMCRRHYFTGHLDYAEKRVIFESDASASSSVIRCPGCGAPARVEGSNTVCAYCGSPLTAEN